MRASSRCLGSMRGPNFVPFHPVRYMCGDEVDRRDIMCTKKQPTQLHAAYATDTAEMPGKTNHLTPKFRLKRFSHHCHPPPPHFSSRTCTLIHPQPYSQIPLPSPHPSPFLSPQTYSRFSSISSALRAGDKAPTKRNSFPPHRPCNLED